MANASRAHMDEYPMVLKVADWLSGVRAEEYPLMRKRESACERCERRETSEEVCGVCSWGGCRRRASGSWGGEAAAAATDVPLAARTWARRARRYLPRSSRRRTQATLFADDDQRRTKAKRLPTLGRACTFNCHAPRTPLCVNMLLRAQKKNFGENEPRKQFLKSANLVMSRRRMAMLIARVLTARKLQQISVILFLCVNVPREFGTPEI